LAFRSEILIKLDKKGRVLLPASFRDELPENDRGAFVLYRSSTEKGVINGNSSTGFDAMVARVRAELMAEKGAFSVDLDDHDFNPVRYLNSTSRNVPMESDGRFTLPADFAELLDAADCAMLVGAGDMFQLWNPKRWQARRDADDERMAAFIRGAGRSRA